MGNKHISFEYENAATFAKLEAMAGKVDMRIAQAKTFEQEVKSLKFQLQQITAERDQLKQRVSVQKREHLRDREKAEILDALENQNFTIKNKIAKIVSDIDGKEISEEEVRDLIQTLIGEIDECVRLLQK